MASTFSILSNDPKLKDILGIIAPYSGTLVTGGDKGQDEYVVTDSKFQRFNEKQDHSIGGMVKRGAATAVGSTVGGMFLGGLGSAVGGLAANQLVGEEKTNHLYDLKSITEKLDTEGKQKTRTIKIQTSDPALIAALEKAGVTPAPDTAPAASSKPAPSAASEFVGPPAPAKDADPSPGTKDLNAAKKAGEPAPAASLESFAFFSTAQKLDEMLAKAAALPGTIVTTNGEAYTVTSNGLFAKGSETLNTLKLHELIGKNDDVTFKTGNAEFKKFLRDATDYENEYVTRGLATAEEMAAADPAVKARQENPLRDHDILSALVTQDGKGLLIDSTDLAHLKLVDDLSRLKYLKIDVSSEGHYAIRPQDNKDFVKTLESSPYTELAGTLKTEVDKLPMPALTDAEVNDMAAKIVQLAYRKWTPGTENKTWDKLAALDKDTSKFHFDNARDAANKKGGLSDTVANHHIAVGTKIRMFHVDGEQQKLLEAVKDRLTALGSDKDKAGYLNEVKKLLAGDEAKSDLKFVRNGDLASPVKTAEAVKTAMGEKIQFLGNSIDVPLGAQRVGGMTISRQDLGKIGFDSPDLANGAKTVLPQMSVEQLAKSAQFVPAGG